MGRKEKIDIRTKDVLYPTHQITRLFIATKSYQEINDLQWTEYSRNDEIVVLEETSSDARAALFIKTMKQTNTVFTVFIGI
jgi:hypothetical protein